MTAAAVGYARAGIRRRWRALLLLTVLAGLAGGTVLWSIAAARRTSTAMDRFVAWARPSGAQIDEGPGSPVQPGSEVEREILRSPAVAASGHGGYLALAPVGPDGRARPDLLGSVNPFSSDNPLSFRRFDRGILVDGRLPDPGRAEEVAVNEQFVARQHLGVGDTFRMRAFTPGQIAAAGAAGGAFPEPDGPEVTLRVAGVVRRPGDLQPQSFPSSVVYAGVQNVYLGPAFVERYGRDIGAIGGGLGIALRPAAGAAEQLAAVVRRVAGPDAHVVFGSEDRQAAVAVNRPVHLQSLGLMAFGALAALASLLVAGQALARQVAADTADRAALRSMGMTRREMVVSQVVQVVPVALGAGVVAAFVAWLGSGLAPIGLARKAEVHPGLRADVPVLALGALALALVIVGRTAVATARALGRRPGGGPRRSRVAASLAARGAPAPVLVGVRMAFEPAGPERRTATRTALAASVAAVAAMVSAAVLATSLGRLIDTPRLQGWTWDVTAGNANTATADDAARQAATLHADPAVAGFSAVQDMEPVRIGGHEFPVMAFDADQGGVHPPVRRGRWPRQADEIALGRSTLHRIGARVGDTVTVSGSGPPQRFRVVGDVVLVPTMASGGELTLSSGVALSPSGVARLGLAPNDGPEFLVAFAPHIARRAAEASLEPEFAGSILEPVRPPDVANVARIRSLPLLLAGLLVVLGLGALAHDLVVGARSSRRQLAVLKALGFSRHQVAATVRWQATALGIAAAAIGVPLGLAAGRWGWWAVNDSIGSLAAPRVPALGVATIVVGVLVGVDLLASVPARAAAGLRAARVLRSE